MSRLLDPRILIAIKDLQLAARTTIDGFMSGINKSRIKGQGLEFSQYRSYQPGDDLRLLDWKMYARSDRYYIRESEIETSISVRFLVDASASMNHTDNGYTKIDYAKYLAASLAWLANLQGDAIGLYVLQDGGLFSMASRRSFQHLSKFYFQLDSISPAGKFTEPVHYKSIFSETAKRELLIFITDLYEQEGEIFTLLDSLVSLKHEVIVFHIMGKNELEFDYKGYAALQDLETGQRVNINTFQNNSDYQQQVANYLSATRIKLLNKNIFYRLLMMDQPLSQALRDFLNQRTKLSV